jgi:hypothetical protein
MNRNSCPPTLTTSLFIMLATIELTNCGEYSSTQLGNSCLICISSVFFKPLIHTVASTLLAFAKTDTVMRYIEYAGVSIA